MQNQAKQNATWITHTRQWIERIFFPCLLIGGIYATVWILVFDLLFSFTVFDVSSLGLWYRNAIGNTLIGLALAFVVRQSPWSQSRTILYLGTALALSQTGTNIISTIFQLPSVPSFSVTVLVLVKWPLSFLMAWLAVRLLPKAVTVSRTTEYTESPGWLYWSWRFIVASLFYVILSLTQQVVWNVTAPINWEPWVFFAILKWQSLQGALLVLLVLPILRATDLSKAQLCILLGFFLVAMDHDQVIALSGYVLIPTPIPFPVHIPLSFINSLWFLPQDFLTGVVIAYLFGRTSNTNLPL